MNPELKHLLLADDDEDDCLFFAEALEELALSTRLTTVHDGERLMKVLLKESESLPQVLFLDLNIPRKNGFECLVEIKSNDRLRDLTVIIVSTSLEQVLVSTLYNHGAHYYIRKPSDFSQLKKLIQRALILTSGNNLKRTLREDFVLIGEA